MATALRFCSRLVRAPHIQCSCPPPTSVAAFYHCLCASAPPQAASASFRLRAAHIVRGLRPRGAQEVEYNAELGREEVEARRSRNEKKREAQRAVRWGMAISEFSPPQIKMVLSAVSAEEEVYEAIMLVKRLKPDAREGKRRQFNYIGKLLRSVQPELIESLIQALKDHDHTRVNVLIGQEPMPDSEEEVVEEEIDFDKDGGDFVNAASRWFDGLITKDSFVAKEVYSLHNVEFDRQELRKLVQRVHKIEEESVKQEDGPQNSALIKARKSLFNFLHRLARQSLLEV